MIGVDRVGGQGDSALTIQISQAGWTDVIYLSIYPWAHADSVSGCT